MCWINRQLILVVLFIQQQVTGCSVDTTLDRRDVTAKYVYIYTTLQVNATYDLSVYFDIVSQTWSKFQLSVRFNLRRQRKHQLHAGIWCFENIVMTTDRELLIELVDYCNLSKLSIMHWKIGTTNISHFVFGTGQVTFRFSSLDYSLVVSWTSRPMVTDKLIRERKQQSHWGIWCIENLVMTNIRCKLTTINLKG